MATLCDRLRGTIIAALHRELGEKRVVIVSHGDVMRAFRVILERIPPDTYHEIDSQGLPNFKIGNGQIIHYTRIDPRDPQHVLPYPGWVRSVNPFHPEYAGHDWQVIVRNKYTNAEILAMAEQSKRLVNE
jgi:hypothetical protein